MSARNVQNACDVSGQNLRLIVRQEQGQHVRPFEGTRLPAKIAGHGCGQYPQLAIAPALRIKSHIERPSKFPVLNQPQHLVFVLIDETHHPANRQKGLAALARCCLGRRNWFSDGVHCVRRTVRPRQPAKARRPSRRHPARFPAGRAPQNKKGPPVRSTESGRSKVCKFSCITTAAP